MPTTLDVCYRKLVPKRKTDSSSSSSSSSRGDSMHIGCKDKRRGENMFIYCSGVCEQQSPTFYYVRCTIRRESTREGRKCKSLLAIKTIAGRGGGGPLCDRGSGLLVGGRARVLIVGRGL